VADAMKKPRRLEEVLDIILLLVPTNETAFIEEIKYYRRHAWYQPPERQKEVWCEFAMVFNRFMPAPHKLSDWQLNIVGIFIDRPGITREGLVEALVNDRP
jgi:hypothetical protein